jgi:hypothetical protein
MELRPLNLARSKMKQADIRFGRVKIIPAQYPLLGFCYSAVSIAEIVMKDLDASWDTVSDEEISDTVRFFEELGIRLTHVGTQLLNPPLKGIGEYDLFERNLSSDEFARRIMVTGGWGTIAKLFPKSDIFENPDIIAQVFGDQITHNLKEEGTVSIVELASVHGIEHKTFKKAIDCLLGTRSLPAFKTKDETLVSITRAKEALYEQALSEGIEPDDAKKLGISIEDACGMLVSIIIEKLE